MAMPMINSTETNTALIRSRVTLPRIGASSQVLHSPTSALISPNTSEVRTRPSFGTSTMGNRSEANRLPR